MKRALLGVVIASACWAAGSVTPAAAATCMSDYAFRGDMAHWVYAAGFQTTVANVRTLEKQHLYDLVHRQFASQAAEPPQPLSAPCTSSAAFTDAARRAAIVRRSLSRVNVLIAGFPLTRAASAGPWRLVLMSATTGAAAAVRLATDIGSPSVKLRQLGAQLAALRVELKHPSP